jgi:putative hydrolase of the HAD superfamily
MSAVFLLTNGWNHHARRRAAKGFNLKWAAMEDRHGLSFAAHEEGRVTFDQYLSRVIFYEKRPFTRSQFRLFMFTQSKPHMEVIEMVRHLKARYRLRIAVVSNESREVNAHRIHKFKLSGFVDTFISSCFVHARKPDVEMFRLALDIAQASPRQVLYIENTPMFVQIAESLEIRDFGGDRPRCSPRHSHG